MKNRAEELKKNTIILGIGNFLPKIISFFILPILTGKLTKEEYGTYDFIMTLVSFLLPLATLQIQSAAFRFLLDCRTDKNKKKIIITNIYIVTFPVSIIVAGIILYYWKNLVLITRFLICLYFFSDIVFLTLSQICRGLSYNLYYSVSSICVSATNAIFLLGTLFIVDWGLNGVIFALFLANSFGSCYLIYKCRILNYFDIRVISIKKIKEMISYSWPMVPNNLSGWVLNLSDRVVITHFLGASLNATYAIANKVPNMLAIAQNVFMMAWQENASISLDDSNVEEYYSNMFEKTLTIMSACTILLIGLSPIIFMIIIRGDYVEAYYQMPILFFAMFMNCMSSFLGGIYIAHKKTVNLGVTTILAAICNLTVNLSLIKYIGITAGSISTLIAYILLYMYRLYDIRRFQKFKYNLNKQIKYIILIVIMLFICWLNQRVLNICNLIISIIVFIVLTKNEIRSLLSNFNIKKIRVKEGKK